MYAQLEDFGTGWSGLRLALSDHDLELLIARLNELRKTKGHFHARSDFDANGGGLGDIEFFWAETSMIHNLVIE